MGVQQSRKARSPQDPEAARQGWAEHEDSATSSCPSTIGIFQSCQATPGSTPQTAIPLDSSSESEDDLPSLIRKHVRTHIPSIFDNIIRRDDWKSLHSVLQETVGFQKKESCNVKSLTVHSESRNHRNSKKKRGIDKGSHRKGSQSPKYHAKRSHKAKTSELAPFSQANPRSKVDTASKPGTAEQHLQRDYITARIDAEPLRLNTQAPTASQYRTDEPQQNRLPVSRTCSEERKAALVSQFESRMRHREHVLPERKWGYTIKYFTDSAEIVLDEDDLEKVVMEDRSFADREQANEYLYKKTSPDAVGGLEAIAKRTTTLEGPERLLRVDIRLTNGEYHVMWVERNMVILDKLTEERRKQVQWQPTPRPTFPHYVVTCDLLTCKASRVTRPEDGDRDHDDVDGVLGDSGANVELSIEKLPSTTFTIREMANEYAGKLFLERSRVESRFAKPSDVNWWRCKALPIHKRAVIDARKSDGLYELAMPVDALSTRLGYDTILINVHEVYDVNGPVNF
ncbi:hypothetical protein F4808DRAFT_460610 [Astrocystis sublimbata]|nr:hypothetical protein F4808DRAFT_460610 [Astrocystis sublimbata]